MRAIYILWLRQLKRFTRKRASIIGALGQPIIFLLAFGFGLSPIFEKAGAGNYIQFVAPGIIAMTVLFTAMFTGVEIIWDKQFGFLKETFVAPISRWEIFIGKTLGGATVALIQGLIVFVITFVVGFRPADIALLPLGLLFLVLTAFLFSAIGTAIAARLEDMQGFPLIINFVMQPLFYLSGALFPLAGLPKVLDYITKVNPLSYGVDGMRYALNGVHAFSPWLSLSVIVGFSIAAVVIGVYQFSKIQL
ncbi:MAG TPA: ABC transporter permease [Candidatus Nanoarchaeia archaeon]|nr:ABC transporter permease [Candidatus Nanoarchaeia archaeon]